MATVNNGKCRNCCKQNSEVTKSLVLHYSYVHDYFVTANIVSINLHTTDPRRL